jgi:hypothetical protein
MMNSLDPDQAPRPISSSHRHTEVTTTTKAKLAVPCWMNLIRLCINDLLELLMSQLFQKRKRTEVEVKSLNGVKVVIR